MKKTIFLKAALVAISVIVVGCSTPGIQTFYMGDGVVQYFVYPMGFSGDLAEVDMDFTYRHDTTKNSAVLCNFTLVTKDIACYIINEVYFSDDKGSKYYLGDLEMFYRTVKENKLRYSGKIDFKEFAKVMNSDNITLTVNTDKLLLTVSEDSDAEKIKENIRLEIIGPVQAGYNSD